METVPTFGRKEAREEVEVEPSDLLGFSYFGVFIEGLCSYFFFSMFPIMSCE